MNIFADIEQGTDEWKELRSKYFTASGLGEWLLELPELRLTKKQIAELLVAEGIQVPKDKETWDVFAAALPDEIREENKSYTELRNKAWKNAIYTRIGNLSQDDEPEKDTWAMKRGRALEPEARTFYENENGVTVQKPGFIAHDSDEFGCSPDGLVVWDYALKRPFSVWLPEDIKNGLELKAHVARIHARFLDEGGFREEHELQVQISMAATGVREWHLYGYHPELPPLKEVFEWDEKTDLVLSRLLILADDYEATYLRVKAGYQDWKKAPNPTP